MRIIEETQNPVEILRNCGIKIKFVQPKEGYLEVLFYDEITNFNFSRILKDFKYKVDKENNKLYVGL